MRADSWPSFTNQVPKCAGWPKSSVGDREKGGRAREETLYCEWSSSLSSWISPFLVVVKYLASWPLMVVDAHKTAATEMRRQADRWRREESKDAQQRRLEGRSINAPQASKRKPSQSLSISVPLLSPLSGPLCLWLAGWVRPSPRLQRTRVGGTTGSAPVHSRRRPSSCHFVLPSFSPHHSPLLLTSCFDMATLFLPSFLLKYHSHSLLWNLLGWVTGNGILCSHDLLFTSIPGLLHPTSQFLPILTLPYLTMHSKVRSLLHMNRPFSPIFFNAFSFHKLIPTTTHTHQN